MASLRINPSFYKLGAAWRTWLAQARIFFLFLIVLVTVCIAVDWLGFFLCVEPVARLPYAGFILEAAGVLTVVYGFSTKIDLYGDEPISARIKQWLRSIPLFRQDTRVAVGSAHLTLGPMKVNATGTVSLPPDASLEDRVQQLEHRLENLQTSLSKLREDHDTSINELREELDQRIQTILDDLEALKKLTSEAHIGDVGTELAGIGWILAGLALATIPDGIQWASGPLISLLSIPVPNPACSIPALGSVSL
jgi:hypothetical protein